MVVPTDHEVLAVKNHSDHSPEAESHGRVWTDREGLLELTHNYGTEGDPNYTINNGNDDDEYKDMFMNSYKILE